MAGRGYLEGCVEQDFEAMVFLKGKMGHACHRHKEGTGLWYLARTGQAWSTRRENMEVDHFHIGDFSLQSIGWHSIFQ